MARIRQVTLIAAVVVLITGAWTADAFARPRRVRVVRPVAYSHVYYSPFYWGYWSPWYGPWPSWYGPWDYPYSRRYFEPSGAVRVEVSPRQTQVYVDGYFVGISDDFDGLFQRLRLPAGGHEIVLHLPGHRNAAHSLYLQPGSTYHLRHRMEPLPAGTAEDPPPRPNSSAAQQARPAEDEDAPPSRPVERRWPPRAPADREDQPRDSGFGSLAIRVQPSNAVVLVDGTEWRGAADAEGEVLIQVPAGRHRIELRRDGYEPWSTEIDVPPGVTTPVNVLLRRQEE